MRQYIWDETGSPNRGNQTTVTLADAVRRLGEVMARLGPPFGPLELPAPVPDEGYTAFGRVPGDATTLLRLMAERDAALL
jgi:hypothetical protein